MTNHYALVINIYILKQAWACGGMVDTLVLGTSANAWEFESLHAHIKKRIINYPFFSAVFVLNQTFQSRNVNMIIV